MNPWEAYKSSIIQHIQKNQPLSLEKILKYTTKTGLPKKYVMDVLEELSRRNKIFMNPGANQITITLIKE
jgi:hypothetical protein